ncbi:hypothetical protein [Candidatus Poriferisodalis sp.]|uniref:primosomal protein N' family DNA-binding protein n=1 Tax=Candidatus Poriferisodalis sp. TaxID=3101277 RepID=UPI003B01B1A8
MQRAVQVLVDEPAIDREFTYLLPPELVSGRVPVNVGTIVRVVFNRRRLRGWVTGLDATIPGGRELAPISSVVGVGPPPHVVELARWAARRWAGTQVHFLRTASPDRVVKGLPTSRPVSLPNVVSDEGADTPEWVRDAFAEAAPASAGGGLPAVVRLGPCADEWPLVVEALRHGRSLVLVPTAAWAARLAGRLRQTGVSTALAPRDWPGAASAHVVVGTRAGAWAPCGRLDAVVVFDEHDEAYQGEAAPTWNARDAAVERARRDGARCLLVGPMPSPDAVLSGSSVIAAAKADEREAWPRVQIADRRQDDPATGEWCGEALAELLRSDGTVVCVLNRTGRARLAYCASCGELARSRLTGRALRLEKQQFTDPDSGDVRPAVCEFCGATKFRRARVGVKGVAEEMERLARRAVTQVVGGAVPDATSASAGPGAAGAGVGASSRRQQPRPQARQPALFIGTEAVLHRVPSADTVAFVDFDQELTAPRYRAGEEAFALLVRAARLVGTRSGSGSILVQTRLPDHPVLAAAAEADPSDWLRAEVERRSAMRQPPAAAWALVSGAAAPGYVENLSAGLHAEVLDIAGPADGTWRIRSDNQNVLLDALAAAERPSGRLRVAVDPLRA